MDEHEDFEAWFETKRYQAYVDERKLLIDAEREGARSFDKAILTLTSGAFVVSIAFLKDIVPVPVPDTLQLLWLSWGMFALNPPYQLVFVSEQSAILSASD